MQAVRRGAWDLPRAVFLRFEKASLLLSDAKAVCSIAWTATFCASRPEAGRVPTVNSGGVACLGGCILENFMQTFVVTGLPVSLGGTLARNSFEAALLAFSANRCHVGLLNKRVSNFA